MRRVIGKTKASSRARQLGRGIATLVAVMIAPTLSGQTPASAPDAAPTAIPMPAVAAGSLRIEPGGFDFGNIPPHAERDVSFTMTNTGSGPIAIIEAKPTCLCTAPEDLSGAVIRPGESRSFATSFKAPLEPGEKTATIILLAQDTSGPQRTHLRLRGMITMAVRAEPPYVDALRGVTTGTTRISSTDDRPFRIRSTDGAAPVYADGFDPASDEPRNAYTVQWTIPARSDAECEGMRLWWVVETDHPDCLVLPLRVRHECTGMKRDTTHKQRGWYFDEYLVPTGPVRAGEPVEVVVPIVHHEMMPPVPITAVEATTEGFAAELVSVETSGRGAQCRIRFTPAADASGMFYEMVEFRSSRGNKAVAFVGSAS